MQEAPSDSLKRGGSFFLRSVIAVFKRKFFVSFTGVAYLSSPLLIFPDDQHHHLHHKCGKCFFCPWKTFQIFDYALWSKIGVNFRLQLYSVLMYVHLLRISLVLCSALIPLSTMANGVHWPSSSSRPQRLKCNDSEKCTIKPVFLAMLFASIVLEIFLSSWYY